MSDCLFCRIIREEIKSEKVFEDELVFGFKDINPQAPVHLLISPKRHINAASEATGEELLHLFSAAKQLAEKQKISGSGFRMVINEGEDAGQAIPHLHLHVIGGRALAWPPG